MPPQADCDNGITAVSTNSTVTDIEKQVEHIPNKMQQVMEGPATKTYKSNWNKPVPFYVAFTSLGIMVLVVSLDATMLAVAIPAITSQLGGTTLEAFWASISFMLGVVVTQPIYTSASDVLGRKMSMYAACILFLIGSIIFAVAKSMPIVILGRVIQGLGGGGLDVLSEIITADITTLKERPLWIGLHSIPMAAGTLAGPIIGALLSEYSDWRWIGWMNIPILAVAVILAFFFLDLKPISGSLRSRLGRLDMVGMLLFAVGCTLFCLPLSWAGAMYPWSSWKTIVPLLVGVIFILAFCVWESKPSEPVFPYRIFQSRTAQVALTGALIHGMITYAILIYVPLQFQAVLLQSPLRSAVNVLPMCAMVVTFSGLSAVGVEYTRRYRWEIWLGWIACTVGTGLCVLWDRESSVAEIAGFQILLGIGIGTLFTLPSIPLQAAMESADDHGLASGILVSFRLFGALIGLSMGSTIFSSIFGKKIAPLLPLPEALSALENPSEAVGFIPYLRDLESSMPIEVISAIKAVYNDSMRSIWYTLTAFGGIGLILSFWMEELTLETEELGRQHFEAGAPRSEKQ
ncbi:MFS transporter [Colletotrichum truncatum]|uniref:MFS transporter n=1 Tax=Colletotrichum truncatum TaxID=5467 RepID=A0ACC3Z732_COLTU|nr:MFS transporter [Colletotrichum truncatum]KAF6785260.1 MFS transporter [Colletotrichum truncatum]